MSESSSSVIECEPTLLPPRWAHTTLTSMWEGDAADSRRRNWILPSIVLQATRVGDIHRSVTLLTRDGLVRAMAHGAAKATSRLRVATVPFSYVRAYLYRDPVRDSVKLTDVEAMALHHHLSGNLLKYFTASLWAEVVIKSHAGGLAPQQLQRHLLDALDQLDAAGAEQVAQVSATFLWHALDHIGVAPHLDACSVCGRPLSSVDKAALRLADASMWCSGCAREDVAGASAGTLQELDASLRTLLSWLRGGDTGDLALAQVDDSNDSTLEWDRVRRLLQQLMQHALERPLNTLTCAAGIL